MLLFIDVIFDVRDKDKYNYTGLITTDTPGVRNVPPYALIPKVIMVVNSTGKTTVFDDMNPKDLLRGLGDYMENDTDVKKYGVSLVGWYLDQMVIPVLCANSMIYGVKAMPEFLRKLNDKWSKTMGCSLERAFLQGWYPDDRDSPRDQLTLSDAQKMCGMSSFEEELNSMNIGQVPYNHQVLAARILALNNLFHRYWDIGAGGGC